MAPNLERILFNDYRAGMVRNVAVEDIPENGAWDIDNWLIRADGSLYRRGGITNKTNAPFGTKLRFLWEGLLGPGNSLLFASDTRFGTINEGVSNTPVPLGDRIASSSVMEISSTAVVRSGAGTKDAVPMLFIGVKALDAIPPSPGNPAPQGYIYGGSKKDFTGLPAGGSWPTLQVVNGSKLVTASAAISSNIDVGMLVWVGNAKVYTIESIESTTQFKLSTPYGGVSDDAVVANISPIYPITATSPYVSAEHYCAVADRLIAATASTIQYSAIGKPHVFPDNNFHEVPEGVRITGLKALDQDVLVFTTHGLWILQGMAFEAVDADGNAQHRLFPQGRDLVLWGALGIASWEDALVVPCRGGVYLLDGQGEPVLLSRSIQPYLDSFMDADQLRPGNAVVWRNHYFLPIPDATVLVCRLDAPTKDEHNQVIYPWTRMSFNHPIHSFAIREQDGGNLLFGAQSDSSAHVVDCSRFTRPDAVVKLDVDTQPVGTLITRAAATGQPGNATRNAVRKVRVRGKVVADTGDTPIMTASYATAVGVWHETNLLATAPTFTALTPAVPEGTGIAPVRMRINKKTRWVQFKVVTSGVPSRAYLYSIEAEVRPSEAVRK